MHLMKRTHVIHLVVHEHADELGRADNLCQSEPEQEFLTELLADLCHYCEQEGLDYDYSVESSAMQRTDESSD